MAITTMNTVMGKEYGKGEEIQGKRVTNGRKYCGEGLGYERKDFPIQV